MTRQSGNQRKGPLVAGSTMGPHLDTVSDSLVRLGEALKGRYTIERELGAGGMEPQIFADGFR